MYRQKLAIKESDRFRRHIGAMVKGNKIRYSILRVSKSLYNLVSFDNGAKMSPRCRALLSLAFACKLDYRYNIKSLGHPVN